MHVNRGRVSYLRNKAKSISKLFSVFPKLPFKRTKGDIGLDFTNNVLLQEAGNILLQCLRVLAIENLYLVGQPEIKAPYCPEILNLGIENPLVRALLIEFLLGQGPCHGILLQKVVESTDVHPYPDVFRFAIIDPAEDIGLALLEFYANPVLLSVVLYRFDSGKPKLSHIVLFEVPAIDILVIVEKVHGVDVPILLRTAVAAGVIVEDQSIVGVDGVLNGDGELRRLATSIRFIMRTSLS